ncbi:MAG: helix-turn-helix domain-containing protein [Gammaproteobacteria bacterium]|jgi:DNA-binding Xre family transcriptional regulator|nr:helix-turn-helix domain-containing protein [Gammaproteobacteria bacterium]
MGQTAVLVETLKQTLKSHGKTYRDVAAALALSEASVKRLFASNGLSLQRLDDICQMMGMEISDLVQVMSGRAAKTMELSETQEQQVADDPLLLLVAVSVLNKFTFEDILAKYAISDTELIQKLAHLDRLKIIELLPKNRIKLLISPNFRWRENGPIQRFFQDEVGQEFFASRFDQRTESLVSVSGLLSLTSNELFQRKMARLAEEFADLQRDDERLPLSERHGTTMVLAIRQWEYGLFERLKRVD